MIPETGQLDWEDFSETLNPRTKLVAIGAASNALGTINDIKRAGDMARSLGAQIFVDAVHYAPHGLFDVRDWNCDFLTCSAYKFYGPHIGILYGRHDLLESLDFPKLIPAPDAAPERAETGHPEPRRNCRRSRSCGFSRFARSRRYATRTLARWLRPTS